MTDLEFWLALILIGIIAFSGGKKIADGTRK
jgi:hypothetical protein